jgi:hypothetical protein
MSEPHLLPQLGRTGPTAGGGAELAARPASPRDADEHGRHPTQEHDEESSRRLLQILLRALGAIPT